MLVYEGFAAGGVARASVNGERKCLDVVGTTYEYSVTVSVVVTDDSHDDDCVI